MILQHPEYLWALAALPLMWWMSRPPAPRRRVWTGHLEQWQLAMQSLRRRPPRGSWLRFVLLAVALRGLRGGQRTRRSLGSTERSQMLPLSNAANPP